MYPVAGWGLKGGLPYQSWARDLMLERKAVAGQDDPGSHCLPTGAVKLHTTPLYRKVVQTPALIVILNEIGTSYRQIFTDGRPLPADPQPACEDLVCKTLAKRLQHQAEFGQLGSPPRQAGSEAGVELDDFRQQQCLASDAMPRQRRLHALIDQPLMRRMLIDDDQAVAGLRHDVIIGLSH